jgi:hypothetical protein
VGIGDRPRIGRLGLANLDEDRAHGANRSKAISGLQVILFNPSLSMWISQQPDSAK